MSRKALKVKWKIIISVVALLPFVVSIMISTLDKSNEDEEIAELEIVDSEEVGFIKVELPGDVDRLLNEMEFGAIAFNAPNSINIDDSSQIQLILSLTETVEQIKKSITQEGEKVGTTIKVSDRMEANLSGYMFEITTITDEEQAVSKSQQTEWKWEIHPKEEGKHQLHLTLKVLLDINGFSTQRVIESFDEIIEVNITPTQRITNFLGNNWEWVWGSILVPVIGLLWKPKDSSDNS